MLFAGCEQTITSDSISSDELNSELSAQQGPTLQPPSPNVEHSVDTFNPLLEWNHVSGAVKYKIEREKCCTDQDTFTVTYTNDPELDFKDTIIHSHLEAVDTAIPDEWLRYRVKAVFSDDESAWTGWLYYHLPEENNM